jgi:hypothetical protein
MHQMKSSFMNPRYAHKKHLKTSFNNSLLIQGAIHNVNMSNMDSTMYYWRATKLQVNLAIIGAKLSI